MGTVATPAKKKPHRGRKFPRRKQGCRPHAWSALPIRSAARVDGKDGYRLLERCSGCKTRRLGPFVAITTPIAGVATRA